MKVHKVGTLPKGAKEIKVKKKIGGWVEMEFDAKLIHRGIQWLRVKDGFGDKGDREDWVADIPITCISVSDYHFRKEMYWGFKEHQADTIFGAMDIQLLEAKEHIAHRKKEQEENLAKLSIAQDQVDLAVSDITRNHLDI